jgi:hypothetical protein
VRREGGEEGGRRRRRGGRRKREEGAEGEEGRRGGGGRRGGRENAGRVPVTHTRRTSNGQHDLPGFGIFPPSPLLQLNRGVSPLSSFPPLSLPFPSLVPPYSSRLSLPDPIALSLPRPSLVPPCPFVPPPLSLSLVPRPSCRPPLPRPSLIPLVSLPRLAYLPEAFIKLFRHKFKFPPLPNSIFELNEDFFCMLTKNYPKISMRVRKNSMILKKITFRTFKSKICKILIDYPKMRKFQRNLKKSQIIP